MMNKTLLLMCASVAAAVSAPATFAHNSIAARYVVPDARTEWRVYNPRIHRSTKKDLISYKIGWYIGAGGGLSEASPEGSDGGFYVKDDRDLGYKVFGGVRFTPHWSTEVSYVNTGEAGLGNVNPAIEAAIPDATIQYRIPTIAASYHFFGPKRDLDVIGRVGLSSITNDVSDSRIRYERQTKMQLNLGVGAQWRFAEKWFLRGEFESFDNDASMISVSLGRYFGFHQPHAEPSPGKSSCQQFNGAIDAIEFEVDSDRLIVSSEERLKDVALNLLSFPDVTIEIQAHTDSSASEEYNLDLSLRRAQTIKRFLQDEGVPEFRLFAKGYGESLPRATNETPEGRAMNRRVEFKVLEDSDCN